MLGRTPLALAHAIAIPTALLLCAAPALARPIFVRGSIQDAIDAAEPGDTIVVPRGNYAECPVIDKDHLTVVGPRDAVIDATGCSRGLTVGREASRPIPTRGCASARRSRSRASRCAASRSRTPASRGSS
jgi:hypothetical protein